MFSLSDNKEGDVIEKINSTLRYLDGYLNIGNPYFEHMASRHISQKFKQAKLIILILKLPFWTWTCPLQMA